MIYTVTLNPSLDYVMRPQVLRPGTVNRSAGESWRAGGKGINVSRVLTALGVPNLALGFKAGFTGEAIEAFLRERRVSCEWITLPQGLSRINVKLRGEAETEINGRGPAVDAASLDALLTRLDRLESGDVLVLAGSIPEGLPLDLYARLLAGAAGRGVLCAVDAQGDALRLALTRHPFLIKPNREELSQLVGRELVSEEEILAGAASLQEQGARNVLVSLGGDGAILLDEGGRVRRARALTGQVIDPVGAGDSMLAGFLAGCELRGDFDYALRLGTACGCATAFSDDLAGREQISAALARLEAIA